MTALLEIDDLHAGYGEVRVVHGLSLTVGAGEVVCIIGPNGAGKTTTLMAVTGMVAATAGTVRFEGQNLAGMAPHRRVELGIALAPEGRQVMQGCTVEENLLLGSCSQRARAVRPRKLEEVYGLFPRLKERRRQLAGLMSGGEQQMLAIGRALMTDPRLLMLDEPSLGLAPKVMLDVYDAVAKVAASGLSILVVEQNTQTALSVAGRGYVLAHGAVVAEGSSNSLRDAPSLRDAFFGSRPAAQPGDLAPPKGPTLLTVRNVQKHFGGVPAIDDFSLELHEGEFCGLIGPNGAGKTTLMNLLTGYLRPDSGSIAFAGKSMTGLRPYQCSALGIARTFQIVRPFPDMTVAENVLTASLFAGRMRDTTDRQQGKALLDLVGLGHRSSALAGTLTLGEKKRLEVARCLATKPRMLLLDEVLGGLSDAEMDAMCNVLRDVHAGGITILMIEHVIRALTRLVDRLVVLNFGRNLCDGAPAEVLADQTVIDSYLGRPHAVPA